MDLHSYRALFPDEEIYHAYFVRAWTARNAVAYGLWQFTADTAEAWAGPFSGSCAFYMLYKETKNLFTHTEARQLAMNFLQRQLESKPKNKQRYVEQLQLVTENDVETIQSLMECATVERPWRLYVTGNDDTSYSRWFETMADGTHLMSLLDEAQPIDFYRDFLPFRWTFTN